MNQAAINLENAIKSLEKVSTYDNVVQYPFIAGFLSSAIIRCASQNEQVANDIIFSITDYVNRTK